MSIKALLRYTVHEYSSLITVQYMNIRPYNYSTVREYSFLITVQYMNIRSKTYHSLPMFLTVHAVLTDIQTIVLFMNRCMNCANFILHLPKIFVIFI